MFGHAAVQIPLLATAGFLAGRALAPRFGALAGWNARGVPGLLIGSAVASVWMLPRAMDGALASQAVELAKFTTLPCAAGLPLGLSWPELSPLLRSFVFANAASMLAAFGWLYHAAPIRVCNFYLVDEQRVVGTLYLAAAAVIVAAGLLWAFARPGHGAPQPLPSAGTPARTRPVCAS
jgi:hypothetical protein